MLHQNFISNTELQGEIIQNSFFVKQKIHKCILVEVSIRVCFLMMIILILNTLSLFILLAVFLFVNGIEILYCALFVNKNMTRAFICLPNNKFRSVFRL